MFCNIFWIKRYWYWCCNLWTSRILLTVLVMITPVALPGSYYFNQHAIFSHGGEVPRSESIQDKMKRVARLNPCKMNGYWLFFIYQLLCNRDIATMSNFYCQFLVKKQPRNLQTFHLELFLLISVTDQYPVIWAL